MTKLLFEIQETKKFDDPKYTTEYTYGGFFVYVTIPINMDGRTTEFKSV